MHDGYVGLGKGVKRGEIQCVTGAEGVGKSMLGETKKYPNGTVGKYTCQCICGKAFIGHKRDNLCVQCDPGENEFNNALFQKIEVGAALTNAELLISIDFYQDLARKLFILGDMFKLPWLHCHNTLCRLQGFQRAREE